MSAVIEIRHLSKYYGRQRGVEDLSFSVEEGEIFGFIGPNGAGKSTTIRTLLALLRPTSGSALLFGRDCIREAPIIAREVGYLPAETCYYENMRVRGLLDYAAALYHKDCRKKTQELCERLALDTSRKISDLSLGNRKKVGIVQGLLHSPRLIILDEPTSGLDPLMQQTFFDLLREENERGASILFSSHILGEVQRMCSRVAILKEGRLTGVQNVAELRGNEYKRISLTATADIPEDYFKLPGIATLECHGTTAKFMYKGEVNALLERLWRLGIADITIEEPPLEEIFLHYYQ